MATTKKPRGDAPATEPPTEPPADIAGQDGTTEDAPRAQTDYGQGPTSPTSTGAQIDALVGTEAKPLVRCETEDDKGRQCLYEQHSDRFPHLFEVDAPPKIAPGATGPKAVVKRQTINTWWCPNCDNAQQLDDLAACRKCGTIPKFP